MTTVGRGFGAIAGASGAAFHPIFQQELKYQAVEVGDDPDGQVADTISLMRKYVMEDAQSPEITGRAQLIRAACGGDSAAEVQKVWEETKSIGFLRDEITSSPLEVLSQAHGGAPIIEVLIRPRDMAAMKYARYGDCDDFSMYAAALLTALGIPCAFVTLAGDDSQPNIFSHVYVAAYPGGGQRVAVDASHGQFCGWEANKPWGRKKEWPVDGPSLAAWVIGIAAAAIAAWGAWEMLK